MGLMVRTICHSENCRGSSTQQAMVMSFIDVFPDPGPGLFGTLVFCAFLIKKTANRSPTGRRRRGTKSIKDAAHPICTSWL